MSLTHIDRVLRAESPAEIEDWCREEIAERVLGFQELTPAALMGSLRAARGYVSLWRGLRNDLLFALRDAAPDLVCESGGQIFVVDVQQQPCPVSLALLDLDAIEAPFSPWVARSGFGIGVCASLVQRIRQALPGVAPIAIGPTGLPHWNGDAAALRQFRRNVLSAIDQEASPIERIAEVFDLSLTEMGQLFGVSRQAISQWIDSGVPAERQEKVAAVLSTAELLEKQLRTELVPGVVRRPADAYGGRSALDMIAADRHGELLELTRASFDWARSA